MAEKKKAEVEYVPETGEFVENMDSVLIPKAKIIYTNKNKNKSKPRSRLSCLFCSLSLITTIFSIVFLALWFLGIPKMIHTQEERINNLEEKIYQENKQKLTNDICAHPKDAGPCFMHLPRWYFDLLEGKCLQFTFGGCQGNENNFVTQSDCSKACENGMERGVPLDTKAINKETDEEENPCKILPKAGPCDDHIQRYYYDFNDHTCKPFSYSGCAGNTNNFLTESDCKEKCGTVEQNQNPCSMPAEVGMCRAAYPKWYYDSSQKECRQFIYGGCGGNDNRFTTKEECRQSCQKESSKSSSSSSSSKAKTLEPNPICQLPSATGRCRAAIQRYFYNAASGKCETFTWGGCEGNDNNFSSEDKCRQLCQPERSESSSSSSSHTYAARSMNSICQLPSETGPCRAAIERYFYNPASGRCQTFTWGGCEGNANNFESSQQCEQLCP